ncbi:MAG: ATP phosphoribosyltransferase regulatory subunit [Pseudomonadota bacterium]
MATKQDARAAAETILAAFLGQGAVPVETDILQPAGTLLDLYGEDIRARAYVTSDPIRGEMMLRPDFTVPVVQMHMAQGADPARYAYLGEVFRKQDRPGPRRPEYIQVGYEVFGRDDPTGADAEVFALFAGLLEPLCLRPVTGDLGILMAAVRGLNTLPARKAALLRHVWRPARFKALLDRYGGQTPVPETRRALLDGAARFDAPLIGLRSEEEIAARIAALREDAAAPPISAEEVALLDRLMDLSATAPEALTELQDIARALPAIVPAVARMAGRLSALDGRGVDVTGLAFEASHGRTTLEYYDGFVFSFHAADPALPPVASGGRYDALTAVLGAGRSIPAVGGIIRPGLVTDLGGLGGGIT